jgi:hypothetical protein
VDPSSIGGSFFKDFLLYRVCLMGLATRPLEGKSKFVKESLALTRLSKYGNIQVIEFKNIRRAKTWLRILNQV